ncbi:MAG TPA: hypothetical protein VG940_09585 [Gemmatimonadales bacterium]|nr:hypothetical protein [Gemmatimonadales bacterium]
MTTNDWTDRLSEYLDETLTPEERSACEAWLASSEEGRALLADLRRVVAKAKTLPDAPVPEAIWSGIASAIATPDAKVRPIGSAQRHSAAAPQRRHFTPLQLAAAAAILLALGVGIGSKIRTVVKTPIAENPTAGAGSGQLVGYGRTPHADASYDKAIQELQVTLDQNRSTLDTATVRVLESSLAKIDAALAEAQRALAADRDDQYLNDHLSRIKRKKLDLLRQAAALVQAS